MIHHYVIKFVSELWQIGVFLQVLQFPPPIKQNTTIYLKYCWKWCWTQLSWSFLEISQGIRKIDKIYVVHKRKIKERYLHCVLRIVTHKINLKNIYYYHWIDISLDWLLVSDSIIRSVIRALCVVVTM